MECGHMRETRIKKCLLNNKIPRRLNENEQYDKIYTEYLREVSQCYECLCNATTLPEIPDETLLL